ncbi:PREDICTED: uncharacterized protein LOC104812320 [Tarenaya hassleriana]|uniref:uncharacterized protein LOC104812320 n=1 Tax=Tarenaya hassleriana TaxID=28532 RepID=UPI00053C5107|nr:PREDICTED: uncharacterized protein LOC104812320 [Tarenaya hassleriana]XP_010537728.1 PREDICTED: uncharacterized protein LOC104812320 [Tarenaya hassleriana]
MSLYDDEALKQEVIYLHSLWYKGPPTRNPNPTWHPALNRNPGFDPIQRPRTNYIPPADLNLPSRYVPVAARSHLVPRKPNHPIHLYKRPGPDPGPEWPAREALPSPPMKSGWREFRPNPSKKPRKFPPEELAKLMNNKLQNGILQACREFFAGKSNEYGGYGSEDGEGDDDQSPENVSSAEFEFFSRTFDQNGELKQYYEKNARNGEFWCLACGGGGGEKSLRKFKSCLALVQHSLTIHKTGMRTAHRAYAQVICNVLGWDVNNPVASSQKDSQVTDEGTNVECRPECSSDPNKPPEKQLMSAEEQANTEGKSTEQQ